MQLGRIVGELRPLNQARLALKNLVGRAFCISVSICKLAVLLGQFRLIVLSELRKTILEMSQHLVEELLVTLSFVCRE